jgi:hypothetical protein
MLALMALPAQAQMGGGGGGRHRGGDTKGEQKKPAIDEKAYKAALEKIPEPKEKYDPWSGARPTDPAKKTKQ